MKPYYEDDPRRLHRAACPVSPLAVPCPYCREQAGDPCRNTMLPGYRSKYGPVHLARIEAAEGDWDTEVCSPDSSPDSSQPPAPSPTSTGRTEMPTYPPEPIVGELSPLAAILTGQAVER